MSTEPELTQLSDPVYDIHVDLGNLRGEEGNTMVIVATIRNALKQLKREGILVSADNTPDAFAKRALKGNRLNAMVECAKLFRLQFICEEESEDYGIWLLLQDRGDF